MPGMNPKGIQMKLPMEQMSEAIARPEVRAVPAGTGCEGGDGGGEAGGLAAADKSLGPAVAPAGPGAGMVINC